MSVEAIEVKNKLYDDKVRSSQQAMAEPETGIRDRRGNDRGRPQREESAQPLPLFDQP